MSCFDDAEIQALADGSRALDPAALQHLGSCHDCRTLLAALVRGGGRALPSSVYAAPADEPTWDELGQGVVVDGRFELERFLGSGGMGVVWSARVLGEGGAGSTVALKIARGTDADLRRRFEREARIAASLHHAHVVRTHGVVAGTDTRGPCLVQELLHGETLELHLARTERLPLPDVARILLPVASALEAAHARGIVHRDVKPQNVFLTPGRVVVLDFGIAKLMPDWGAHSRLTRSGAVLGTPRYMAPEQLFGEPDVDARADVWALAALAYRMLVGRPPVEAQTLGQAIRELSRGAVRPVHELAGALPPDVARVVDLGLVVARAHRTVHLTDFVRALQRFA